MEPSKKRHSPRRELAAFVVMLSAACGGGEYPCAWETTESEPVATPEIVMICDGVELATTTTFKYWAGGSDDSAGLAVSMLVSAAEDGVPAIRQPVEIADQTPSGESELTAHQLRAAEGSTGHVVWQRTEDVPWVDIRERDLKKDQTYTSTIEFTLNGVVDQGGWGDLCDTVVLEITNLEASVTGSGPIRYCEEFSDPLIDPIGDV